MPPTPASIIVSTQAADEVRDAFTPAQARELRAVDDRRASRDRDGCGEAPTRARWQPVLPPRTPRSDRCSAIRRRVRSHRDATSRAETARCPEPSHCPARASGDRQSQVEDRVPERLDEPQRQRGQGDEEADRADDSGIDRRGGEAAQQDAVEREAEQRSEDQYGDRRGRNDGDVETSVELEEEVRGDEGDRAVRRS